MAEPRLPDRLRPARLVHCLSIVNGVISTQSETPSAFFHCFTRSRSVNDAFETLRLMLDIRILLTPEQLTFYPSPTVTQSPMSFPRSSFQGAWRGKLGMS